MTNARATYVAPDTPYLDEPDETVPPGWWVTACGDDPDNPTVTIHVVHAVDAEAQLIEERTAKQIAAALTVADTDTNYWLERTGGRFGVELCPSCAPDGDYGLAVEHIEYRCPLCCCLWSPAPNVPATRTRLGAWLQRLKVHRTTPRPYHAERTAR